MTTETILEVFLSYGGLRLIEQGVKYGVTKAKKVLADKKYSKTAKEIENVAKNMIKYGKALGGDTAIESVKVAVLQEVSKKTGLNELLLEKIVDEVLDTLKDELFPDAEVGSPTDPKVTLPAQDTNTTQK